MTKQDIIDYVMTTPSNPNKAVLEGMLDSIADAGGGGSSRVLLYENDAVNFASAGDWLYASPSDSSLDATFKVDSGDFTLQVDGEEYTSELAPGQNSYYMGVMSPGDTEHIGINKMGCAFNVTSGSRVFITTLGMVMLSPTDFAAGTHSVKIYKEI